MPHPESVIVYVLTIYPSVKISRNTSDSKVYQAEYAVDRLNHKVWYDLSSENGAPFQDFRRKLYIAQSGCGLVNCEPGQYGKDPVHGCDWPKQPSCATIHGVVASLC